jgi:hypothetical protein
MMPESQVQETEKEFWPPRRKHDAVAAVNTVPSQRTSTSLACINQYEDGLLCHVGEAEAELPPYETLSTETFVVSPGRLGDLTCSDTTQSLSRHPSYRPITEGLNFVTYDDFILFPSDSEWTSEQESSVVSCSVDDLPSSSQHSENSSVGSSVDLSVPSPEKPQDLRLEWPCEDCRQGDIRSNSNVVDWLCDVNRNDDCPRLEHMSLLTGSISAGLDDEESA